VRRESLMGRAWVAATLTGALLMLCGCSSKSSLYPVRGKVLFKGQPAVGARVTFYPKDNSDPQALHPTGIVAADGTFTLSSHETDDGAPAGDYIVTVVWPDTSAKGSDSIKQPLHDRLRGAYSNPDKQVLHAQVTIGDNELPAFELR